MSDNEVATIGVPRRTELVFLDAAGVCRDVIGREMATRPMATRPMGAGRTGGRLTRRGSGFHEDAAACADRMGGRNVGAGVGPYPCARSSVAGGRRNRASGSALAVGRHAIWKAAISTAADWRATLAAGAAGAS